MSEKFEIPNQSSKPNKFENHTLLCVWNEWNDSVLNRFILDSFANVPCLNNLSDVESERKNEDHEKTLTSLKHQVDISLRKMISKYMKWHKLQTFDNSAVDLESWLQILQALRGIVLQKIQKSVIDDDNEMKLLIEAFEHEFEEMVESYLIQFANSAGKDL